MNRFVKMVFIAAFAYSATLAGNSMADTDDEARYRVTDVVHPRNSRIEHWKKRDVPLKDEESFHYKITKRQFGADIMEIETNTEWFTESRPNDGSNYLKMRFAKHPDTLEPGQRSFGHVEEVGEGANPQKWPMFYKGETRGEVRRVSFVVMIPNGLRWFIIKEYEDGMYHFPRKEENIIRLGPKVVEHFIYEKSD